MNGTSLSMLHPFMAAVLSRQCSVDSSSGYSSSGYSCLVDWWHSLFSVENLYICR